MIEVRRAERIRLRKARGLKLCLAALVLAIGVLATRFFTRLTATDDSLELDDWILVGGNVLGGLAGGLVAVLIYRSTVRHDRAEQARQWERQQEDKREEARRTAGRRIREILTPLWSEVKQERDPEDMRSAAQQLYWAGAELRAGWVLNGHDEQTSTWALIQLAEYIQRFGATSDAEHWDWVGGRARNWVSALVSGEDQEITYRSQDLARMIAACEPQ